MKPASSPWPPPLLSDPDWQMQLGERAALEGMLATLKPELSIEVGTAQGGSLRRIAANSREVHSFDLDVSAARTLAEGNVHLHEGDSRETLPRELARLAEKGRNVDFALVDGDHSVEGARADVTALLGSPAVGRTVVLLHDTMNPEVREGIGRACRESPVPVSIDLDFVPGFLALQPPFEGELWGGLGLLLVGAEVYTLKRADTFGLLSAELASLREFGLPRDRDGSALLARLDQQRSWLDQLRSSVSWRVTRPLRTIKGWFRRDQR